jgi:hypothetical protein
MTKIPSSSALNALTASIDSKLVMFLDSQRSLSNVFSAPSTWIPHSVFVLPSLLARPTNLPFLSRAYPSHSVLSPWNSKFLKVTLLSSGIGIVSLASPIDG